MDITVGVAGAVILALKIILIMMFVKRQRRHRRRRHNHLTADWITEMSYHKGGDDAHS